MNKKIKHYINLIGTGFLSRKVFKIDKWSFQEVYFYCSNVEDKPII
jgi:hypothetical protein